MATLTKPQLDDIRAALLPLLQTQENRETLVRAALWGKPVLDRLKWELAAGAFAVQLANVLDNADLADVLKEAQGLVGTEGQTNLARLAAQLAVPAQVRPMDPVVDEPPTDRVKLRDALANLFSSSELETLCFDFGINAETVEGHNVTITRFASGIVLWFQQRDRITELTTYVRKQRPRAGV